MGKRKRRGRAPSSGAGRKSDRFILCARALVLYLELAGCGVTYLKANRQTVPQKLSERMMSEATFCYRALLNIFGMTKTWIEDVRVELNPPKKEEEKETEDEKKRREKFSDQLRKFCDVVYPDDSALVTKNLEQEMGKIMGIKHQEKKIREGGLLIKP